MGKVPALLSLQATMERVVAVVLEAMVAVPQREASWRTAISHPPTELLFEGAAGGFALARPIAGGTAD